MNRTLRVALFPLYLALYDKVRPERRAGLLPFLDQVRQFLSACGVDLIDVGILTTAAEVRRAAALAARADAIITLHLSYSPSLLVADTLEKLGKPLLMLDTTKADRFDEASTSVDVGENHGIHGVMDLSSVLTGRRVPFEVVAGSLRSPRFRERARAAVRVLTTAALFRDQRIGMTGRPFPGMGDFAVSHSELRRRFGVTIHPVSVPQIVAAGRRVPAERVSAEVANDRKRFRRHEVDPRAHADAVRDYLALSTIVATQRLSGYTMNFQNVRQGLATPFYACCRLMSDGIGYAGEGDVLTALLGRPLNHLAGEAFFAEMFCPDWRGGTLFMAHMGEIDVRFARPRTRPLLAQKRSLVNERMSVYPLPELAERAVTLVNLARDADRGFRLVVALADIVRFPVNPGFGMPHFKLKPKMPLEAFLEGYARHGGGHHIFLASGDQRGAMRGVGRHLGLAFAEV